MFGDKLIIVIIIIIMIIIIIIIIFIFIIVIIIIIFIIILELLLLTIWLASALTIVKTNRFSREFCFLGIFAFTFMRYSNFEIRK